MDARCDTLFFQDIPDFLSRIDADNVEVVNVSSNFFAPPEF